MTYSVSLYVKLRLREETILKTKKFTWVSFLWYPSVARSSLTVLSVLSSVSFTDRLVSLRGKCSYIRQDSTRLPYHPDRGTWLEVQFDQNDLLYVYLDRRRRRRKFLLTTLSVPWATAPMGILNLFYDMDEIGVADAISATPYPTSF